jgi:hypothetical protein
MNLRPLLSPARLLTAVVTIFLAATLARAQNPGQAPSQAAPPAAAAPPNTAPNPDSEWLAKTGKIYYSSARAGLTGFDCAVHPDWRALFASANKGAEVPDDDARLAQLKAVKVTIHARMKGGSTIDWVEETNADKPLDQSSTDLLNGMHQSVQQTLEGFLQFWTPFMEGSVVPATPQGIEITHTATSHKIHAKQGETELTEIFNADLVLEQFNVVLSGTSIKFEPSYKPTPQGLLVSAFVAHILVAGAAGGQEQEMRVGIDYQEVNGLTIPSELNMDVVGTGKFDFKFDGCSTNPS